MSNTTVTPPGRKPTDNRARGKNAATPDNRRISKPVQLRQEPKRDLFGIYFVAGVTALILLFGVVVYYVRSQPVTPAIVATPTTNYVDVTGVPVEVNTTPVSDFAAPPIPTLPAPDALNSREYVTGEQVTSEVGAVDKSNVPMMIPKEIPQAQLDLSDGLINLGDVTKAQTPSALVTIANPAAVDLVIRTIYTDCDCLKALTEAKTLKTGQRMRMSINYAPSMEAKTGKISHTISIISTDGQSPITEITLEANIK